MVGTNSDYYWSSTLLQMEHTPLIQDFSDLPVTVVCRLRVFFEHRDQAYCSLPGLCDSCKAMGSSAAAPSAPSQELMGLIRLLQNYGRKKTSFLLAPIFLPQITFSAHTTKAAVCISFLLVTAHPASPLQPVALGPPCWQAHALEHSLPTSEAQL